MRWIGVLFLLALAGCRSRSTTESAPGKAAPSAAATSVPVTILGVPRAGGPIKTDGELDEPSWRVCGRTGAFIDATGGPARPYSDARFLWDDQNLYMALYAADDEITATVTQHDGPVWIDDAFSVRLTPPGPTPPTFAIDVSPASVVTDVRIDPSGARDPSWESGMRLGVDMDGTLNDPSNEDEEWVVESAIPFSSFGVKPAPGVRIAVQITRCDIPHRQKEKRCGGYGEPQRPVALELRP
jgi:hypothetical protein